MRIWSAVARAMLSLALSLTSCTRIPLCPRSPSSVSVPRPLAFAGGVFFVGATLRSTQVDPKRFGGSEGVLVELADLDLFAELVHHPDVEAQRLHLLDEHLEALGNARLGDVLPLDDRLVDLDPSEHIVGFDGQDLLQRVRRSVGLERPDLHLPEALTPELGLPAEGLLGDHRVRTGRTRVDLVVDQVGELQDVHASDRHGAVVGLPGLAVVQDGLPVAADEVTAVPVSY